MEFLTLPVVSAAIATGILSGGASLAGSWFMFRSKVREAESALIAKEKETRADLRKHLDDRVDAKMTAYIDRLEAQLSAERDYYTQKIERIEREAADKIEALRSRVLHLESENKELKGWAAAIRRDLWHVHRYLHAMRMAIVEGNTDRADDLALRALAKLDDMLDESEGLVEDSTPTIDDLES